MIGVIFDRNIGRLIFLLKKVTKQLKIKAKIKTKYLGQRDQILSHLSGGIFPN